MKTGRLLKFNRAGADIQAYLYREGGRVLGAVYVLSGPGDHREPRHSFSGRTEAEVEASVRAWVEERFPRVR